MEFEEFSRQFRERTAQRMVEFEAALARAQRRMEQATAAGQAGSQQERGRQSARGTGQSTPVSHRRRRPGPGAGEVRGILHRD